MLIKSLKNITIYNTRTLKHFTILKKLINALLFIKRFKKVTKIHRPFPSQSQSRSSMYLARDRYAALLGFLLGFDQ